MKFENAAASSDKQTSSKRDTVTQDDDKQQQVPVSDNASKPAPGSRMQEAGNIWAPAVGTLPHQPKSERNLPPQNISVKKSAPAPPSSSSRDAAAAAEAPPKSGPQGDSAPAVKSNVTARNTVTKDGKKAPPPQAIVKPTLQKPPQDESKSPGDQAQKPQTQSSPVNKKSPAENSQITAERRKPSESGSLDSTPSRDVTLAPHSGTLSDLKKQRAQALQERLHNSLRFKDTEQLNEQLQNHNSDSRSRSQSLEQKQNGASPQNSIERNGGGQMQRRNNNNVQSSSSSGDSSRRKYKFTDTTVVGDDSDTSCCTVQ